MLLEDFFKHEFEDREDIVNHFYTATLAAWLTYNEFEIFDTVLKFFEEKEEYLICEGIHKAIDKIDEIYNDRFEQATILSQTEDSIEYTYEEHKRISRLIFEDVLIEIYEKQIGKLKKDS